MAKDLSKILPKDIPGRIALVLCAIFVAPICAAAAYALFHSLHRKQLWESLALVAAGETAAGLCLFFLCGFIWAICTPRWVEWLTEHIFTHIFVALIVFLVPLTGALFWGLIKGF